MHREHSLTPWVGAISFLRFWLTAGVLRRLEGSLSETWV